MPKTKAPNAVPPTALITGGAIRIGSSIAQTLAKNGYNLAIHYSSSKESALKLQAQLLSKYPNIHVKIFSGNFNHKSSSTLKLIKNVWQKMGHVTLLVNNAAVFEYDNPTSFTKKSLQKHFNINLLAPLITTQSFYNLIIKNSLHAKQDFCAINILDHKLFAPNPDYFSYSLTKSTLYSATVMMAMQFAPNLRVCGVAPGLTLPSKTMSKTTFTNGQKVALTGSSGSPQAIADTILFLANNKSITGEIIKVDGGQSLMGMNRDVIFSKPISKRGK